jgi:acetoin utilization protein AcuB
MTKPKTINDYAHRNTVTIDIDAPLADAVSSMQAHRIRHLCVLEEGRLVGILTDRDVKRALPSVFTADLAESQYEKVLTEISVGRVMTKNPITVSLETPLIEGVSLMLTHRISGLPVIEEGQLVGIITETDCLLALRDFLQAS